ncbi:glycoside hydrolase family 2 [Lachnoclostridium sp. An169]|uniref:glycoside hydrolase family 2 protein n=1 Tax=Lachnoclostridium sp. An169 TaxID=1965569 RepID=UPI000B38D302|nr:glycoside hydrolase family 2 TIM barrel-domain containing protein [Lachnoclostridium sp. An169]OUP83450.1 glycoside hydrolase family 2 [Lachnoclostridium sp. An169]
MQKQLFNSDWYFTDKAGGGLADQIHGASKKSEKVELPHDAMIHEKRTPDAVSGSQSGFYPGGVYQYTKKFYVPEEWKDQTVIFEFEGVYAHAMVYINGDYAGGCLYGYSNFYVCADEFQKYGEDNEIRVTANNSMQPNSRWYSGSGIYRSVNLFTGGMLRIPVNGVRITPKNIRHDTAVAEVEVKIENDCLQGERIKVHTEIIDPDGNTAAEDETVITVYRGDRTGVRQRILLSAPRLWDCDSPELYTARVSLNTDGGKMDCVEEKFGVREISVDPVNGFCLNGKTVNLRGTCIHHDNGIIGAATYYRAEERRCRQLKEAGFNCIRSSHHPMGKAMLDACDRIGMLVMDELSDMWTRPKNTNDYAQEFVYHWEEDVEKIVEKDYNHPCVILYSTGNEIQEAGTPKGAQMNRRISDKFKELDATRFTTSAANGLIAASDCMKEIMTDVLREAGSDLSGSAEGGAEGAGGSNLLNNMMSLVMSGKTGDAFAAHPKMTERLEEFADATDIAGYNYLTGRHALEHQLNPNRVVLGTETFPGDIVRLWDVVKKNSHVIGDMTWTGYDYLGEAGCGIFYYDGKANFSSNWPDRAAYIGDIDLTGYRRPVSYLRQIVFGLRKEPYIAVERVNRYGQPHSMTPWMFKDNIASWTWPGYEGKPAKVDVYCASPEVELFLNGESVGRKPAGEENGYTAPFEMTYHPGELKAVGYRNGQMEGEFLLYTAGEEVRPVIQAETQKIHADSQELVYITVGLEDASGYPNLYEVRNVSVQVEGTGVLQGFGNADPQSENSYDDTVCPTYDGYVMAVVRSTGEKGTITVTFTVEGCGSVQTIIEAE